ncbi:hypothetical protein JZ751_026490 [Albula glossodonta]|uniref:Uncharacterized protein n=1 Tax=Albula glossodonta TaxID=121402 RepID=A0A8T2PLP7_9TELE|nr:hypothetical protein JZ751_026490 [Albula glossodonta]
MKKGLDLGWLPEVHIMNKQPALHQPNRPGVNCGQRHVICPKLLHKLRQEECTNALEKRITRVQDDWGNGPPHWNRLPMRFQAKKAGPRGKFKSLKGYYHQK